MTLSRVFHNTVVSSHRTITISCEHEGLCNPRRAAYEVLEP